MLRNGKQRAQALHILVIPPHLDLDLGWIVHLVINILLLRLMLLYAIFITATLVRTFILHLANFQTYSPHSGRHVQWTTPFKGAHKKRTAAKSTCHALSSLHDKPARYMIVTPKLKPILDKSGNTGLFRGALESGTLLYQNRPCSSWKRHTGRYFSTRLDAQSSYCEYRMHYPQLHQPSLRSTSSPSFAAPSGQSSS